jgi:hypothetical protein
VDCAHRCDCCGLYRNASAEQQIDGFGYLCGDECMTHRMNNWIMDWEARAQAISDADALHAQWYRDMGGQLPPDWEH